MKSLILAVPIIFGTTLLVSAQSAPNYYAENYPSHALDEWMALRGALGGEEAALDAKTRQLISLGVAAQIPCRYCIYAHMQAARSAGATDEEIREAVATAAAIVHNSTILNGMDVDFDAFKQELDERAASR